MLSERVRWEPFITDISNDRHQRHLTSAAPASENRAEAPGTYPGMNALVHIFRNVLNLAHRIETDVSQKRAISAIGPTGVEAITV